jgi:hypothetical protein
MHEVLGVFLVEQRRRLSRKSFDEYDSVIVDLALFLHDHGPDTLEGAERALVRRTTLPCGCVEHDYLKSYGPEHILRNLDSFMATQRHPTRMTDRHRARISMRVARKLRAWLTDGGWLKTVVPQAPGCERGRVDFAQGRLLTKTMTEVISTLDLDYEDIDRDDDLLDSGLHDVSKICGDDLWFHHWPRKGPVRQDVGPVRFPAVARALRPGSVVGCTMGRVRGEWYLFEVSCVYPV